MLVERRPFDSASLDPESSLDPEVLGTEGRDEGQGEEIRKLEGRSVDNEARVVAEAVKGSQRAYTQLLNTHKTAVYNLLRRMTGDEEEALDLSQQTFVKAFGSLETFDPSFSFRSWIMKIASRTAIDFLRKRKPETVSLDEVAEVKSKLTSPDAELERKETRGSIESAVRSLPPEYRIAILLRHIEGLSYEEIAEALSLPLGTVKSRVYRGREILRNSLEGIHEPR